MALQFIINGLIIGSVYALVALGFSLIYHTTRVFHLAHGAIFTSSAYLVYLFYTRLGAPLSLSILLSLVCTVSLGFFIEKVIYEPVLTERFNQSVSFISSLGTYIVIVNVIALLAGNETKILLPGSKPTLPLGPVILTRIQIEQLLISLLVIGLVFLFLTKSKFGYIIRALADNSQLISILGVKVGKVRSSVVGLGSGLAGIAAILVTLDTGMDPYIGLEFILVAAVATIIGGIGRYGGTILGAALLGVMQQIVIWLISAQWQSAITFLVLLSMLFFRPQGLLSPRMRVEEL